MSKPGEMVQILREDYEEQLEAYRILRNKFLIAVPGMDLDKEKQLYDQWKLDLHLNSIISFDRAIPTEQRTCETCANEWDALTKEEMWDIIQRIRELTGNDGTESPEQTVARLVEERPATPHHVSTEDVITIRSALNALSEIRRDIQAIEQYEEWSGGSPNYGTCRTFGRIKDIANNSSKALAALDRIAGREE